VGAALAEYVRQLGGADGRLYVDILHALALEATAPPKVRIAAVTQLLDRGYGRRPDELEQTLESSRSYIAVEVLSPETLEAIARDVEAAEKAATTNQESLPSPNEH
jgi:hypothetical protein